MTTVERPKIFDSYNAGYAQSLYEDYLRNPNSVDETWRRIFAAGALDEAGLIPVPGAGAPAAPTAAAPTAAQFRTAIAAAELVDAYRLHGHLAAQLDPLGSAPAGHPALDPAYHGITEADLETLPASLMGVADPDATMADLIDGMRATYAGTIGYEFEHIENAERREWLRHAIETGAYYQPLSAEAKKRLLNRLSEAEALEQFLHRAYLGAKRFSGEGNDLMIPMLDLAVERAAATNARDVIIGMAHRGRLNVLTHVVGRPYTAILSEFEGEHQDFGTTGDVKYHLGAEGTYATASGEPLNVYLPPNPSHLEFIDAVVQGMARAKQTNRHSQLLLRNEAAVLPILLHGDAAFAGQGVVPETLNLARLSGYRTGGTIHLITNNQIGFTTNPSASRSTRYSSDIALGFGFPVFHVNADDPEACLAVMRLALAYREEFGEDVVIDLIGYRRWGHNEGDEPAYTQPILYEKIHAHPTVRKLWAQKLVAAGILSDEEATAIYDAAYQRFVDAQQEIRDRVARDGAMVHEEAPIEPPAAPLQVATAVPSDQLIHLDEQLHTWPEGFTVHPKLLRQLERRANLVHEGGPLDWAHGEALAFASLLTDSRPIRMTGQDVERGTFSHRHLVLHDAETGRIYSPMANLEGVEVPFEIYNSPLSELAVLGYEFGYSVAASETLVLWEAQFGDFANGAQVIIDQFISASRTKWGQVSNLVMLLPHGFEGQGPEHSSARLERFLQLAAEGSMRVVNCTTPAQYFHLLRRQGLAEVQAPLVVFTPKSLLRHPRATSTLEDLAQGSFRPVLNDERARAHAADVSRLILCSGKVYYDLIGNERYEASSNVAIARIEELYPLPEAELTELLGGYPALDEIVWVQEEPENMGAWRYLEPHLRRLAGAGISVRYIGRPERSSPAEGYTQTHEAAQLRITREAFEAGVGQPRVG
jgi:2-oxoglutarate dehydrogenase E1 component